VEDPKEKLPIQIDKRLNINLIKKNQVNDTKSFGKFSKTTLTPTRARRIINQKLFRFEEAISRALDQREEED